ncbi:MAG TPA: glycosyltransferase 87 family protein [Acidobacteriaceae bacterium]|jgi:hypothetical protein|nr:glycosyltransferase 87 family protein [Acidobacteriaceae bacterium]
MRRVFAILGCVFAIAVPWWHLGQINHLMPASHSDLADEWVGVRAALHGQNPYSAEVMRQTQLAYYGRPMHAGDRDPQGFPYPAHLAILFAPLASLSLPAARLAFLLVVIPLLILSFWLCVRMLKLPFGRTATAFAVVLSLSSWPVLWGLRLEQPTLFVIAIVFGGCFLFARRQGTLAGILIACATVKPQLVLLLILFLLAWAAVHRFWSFIVSFSVAVAALLLWAEIIVPHWIPSWLGALHGYGQTHGKLPFEVLLGHDAGFAASAILVVWVGWVLWRLRRSPADSSSFGVAVALALSTIVCITPIMTLTIYNQVAVLPACLVLVVARPKDALATLVRKLAIILLLWGYAAVLISALGEAFRGDGTYFGVANFWAVVGFLNPLLPLAVTVATALLALREPALQSQREPSSALRFGETPAAAHAYDATFYRYIQSGATRSAETIIPIVVKHLPVTGILDVGCGAGAWVAVYRKLGIQDSMGVDGDYVDRTALLVPPEAFAAHDVAQPFDLGRRFSLVQCLEVGEHIDPAASRTLVANLVHHGDCVLFSAAIPGQGGENHVNEQPYAYWRGLFAEHGYAPFDFLRPLLRDAAGVEPWYRHNTLLYAAPSHIDRLPAGLSATRVADDRPIPDVSSFPYRVRTRILAPLPVSWLSRLAVLKHRCTLFFRPVAER